MHQILQDLNTRYTCKKFDASKRISKENIDVFFESLRLSVSSINSQPWKFIIIESDYAKQRMHDTFKNKYQMNQPHIFESHLTILFAYNPKYSRKNFEKIIDQDIANKRISVEQKEKGMSKFFFAELNTDKNGSTENWCKSQVYIALGNALHTLARLKIDSTPMEGIDTRLVNEEFAPELNGFICNFALSIGYRHIDDMNKKLPKSRLKKQDIILTI